MADLDSIASLMAGETKAMPRRASRDLYATVRLQQDGTIAVIVDGSTAEAPATAMVGVHHGDRVLCHIVDHNLVIFANVTAPTTDDATALAAIDRAEVAKEAADEAGIAAASAQDDAATAKTQAAAAVQSASDASQAAARAVADAADAKSASQQAQADASQAAQDAASAAASAQSAEQDASDAAASAQAAQSSASTAQQAATSAQDSASQAATAATNAQASAGNAEASASQAATDAGNAQTSAGQAATAAQEAQGSAASAADSAESAAADATSAARDAAQANKHANDALTQLSFVEDVAGTLSWIREHGTFVVTTDTSVQDDTVYFEYDSTTQDYVPIVSPPSDANPQQRGWYVLDFTDSQSDYIMAHLAVTSAGLWVLPSGIDSQGGPRYSSGYKLLLASDGARVYDGSGRLVATYGESIDFSSERPQHIGGEDAYIAYYDSDDDGVPDSIYIGGSRVTIGSKTLAEFEQAIGDAAAARKYAEDVPIVTLSSTNGTTFKRNLGVSTTIIATIFTPGGRIDDATELRRRFGTGAYLEWGWRDVVTDADHVLVSTDPRIIMDGFGLVVSPGDIDSQAVITCSLNY